MRKEEVKKYKYIVKEIAKKGSSIPLFRLIESAEFEFTQYSYQKGPLNRYNLNLLVEPDRFTSAFKNIDKIQTYLKKVINKSSDLIIDEVRIKPDLKRLEILELEVQPVLTEWEEINQLQHKLLRDLSKSNESTDYQAIGNTARTLMNKLSNIVFDPEKHQPTKSGVDLSEGKFKNRLATFIQSELEGKDNKPLRKFAESAIELMNDSIDLMNTTTHKLDAERHYAELCVFGAIGVVSVVKTIHDL